MKERELRAQLKRRMFLLTSVQLTGLTILSGRLFQLQFIQGDTYRTRAEGNRIKIQLTLPSRGLLQDRTGKPLAENVSDYRLLLERENKKQTEETWKVLQELVPFSDGQIANIQGQLSARGKTAIVLKNDVSWDEVATLEFHRYRLPALQIEKGEQRYYPLGEAAAHIVGYVRKVQEEHAEYEQLRKLPNLRVGKFGCEAHFEQQLRGKPGTRQLEVNATGVAVRELTQTQSDSGQDIRLSLHADLQAYCAQRLSRNRSASAVVMDANTGELLALASHPAFDPNRFARGFSQEYWQSLQGDTKPQINKAIAGQYPPGSTVKMLVGLKALQMGIISPHETVFCPGHYQLGNQRFNCWKAEGHGRVNVSDAIIESCDTFFYEIANRMGMDNLAEVYEHFGLGSSSGLDLIAEQSGLVPSPEWKRRVRGHSWNPGDTVNASIGQGYVLSTPLQLAVMNARLINGGRAVRPRLTVAGAIKEAPYLPYDNAHLELMRRAMVRVVYKQSGTAYGSRPRAGNYSFGGKTGTSQVRRITERGMDQMLLPWAQRHHALFVGFAPTIDPKWVCSVVVEHGGSGSAAAAPIARDILVKLQSLMGEA